MYVDDDSLRVMKFENATGGYQLQVKLGEGFEIPCFVEYEVPLKPDWVSFIFQPFANLRYGEVNKLEGSEDLTKKHAMFAMLNDDHTYAKSVLYWQGTKSGILWCMYDSHRFKSRNNSTEQYKLYVEIYVISPPTAEIALKVQSGKFIKLTCDATGPYTLNASLTWYFRPSTWSFQSTSQGQNLSDYTTRIVDTTPNQERQTLLLVYKVEASGVLECRSVVSEFPDADSSFIRVEVNKNMPFLCDECGDCEYVLTSDITDTSLEIPTAELGIKVALGKIVHLMCEAVGTSGVQRNTILTWHFRASTLSIRDTQDITEFAKETRGTISKPDKLSSVLTYKAETTGTLECRATVAGAQIDSTFIDVEVYKEIDKLCDVCGDCSYLYPHVPKIHTEL